MSVALVRALQSKWRSLVGGEMVIWPALVVGVIVAMASVLVGPKRGDVRVDVALANMAAFLFGVLVAFTIVRTRERLVQVHDLVAKGDASLLSIHQAVSVFDPDSRRHLNDLIDRHLTDQIDYHLVDYHLATSSYLDLTNGVYGLNPLTAQQEGVYKELVSLCIGMQADRALIEAATGQAMSPIEWIGMLLLLLVLLGLIAVLPGGTLWGAVVAGVLGGTLVSLLILLRKLDLLRWHERVSLWEPTARLFRSMGRDPYVPRQVIDSGRYCPAGRVRIVDYPDPYPVRATKTVTVVDMGGGPSEGQATPPVTAAEGVAAGPDAETLDLRAPVQRQEV